MDGSVSSLSVEPMRVEDLEEVLAIERASFTNPWSRHAFMYELRENRVASLWVARAPGAGGVAAVAGYLCLWLVADEVHVTNLAVHPAHRHRGVGRHLLGTLLEHCRQRGAARAVLEVRPSNGAARRLYEALGFRRVGLRKGYYFDTGEDALLLEARLPLTAPTPGEGDGREPAPPLARSH